MYWDCSERILNLLNSSINEFLGFNPVKKKKKRERYVNISWKNEK
jgi:hypothetical protein